jgi:hypothetical protein
MRQTRFVRTSHTGTNAHLHRSANEQNWCISHVWPLQIEDDFFAFILLLSQHSHHSTSFLRLVSRNITHLIMSHSNSTSNDINHLLAHIGSWTSDTSECRFLRESFTAAQQAEHIILELHPDIATTSVHDVATILAEYNSSAAEVSAGVTASLQLLDQARRRSDSLGSSVRVEMGREYESCLGRVLRAVCGRH